ncbi:MAG: hypothetical protein ABWZ79_07935 [Pedobacter agri]
MKYIIIIFFISIVSCNSDNKSITNEIIREDTIITKEDYPAEIIKQGLEKWYDNTKWAMYCIYCDDTCKFRKQTGIKDTITFASLDLKFEEFKEFNDATEISFYFYFRDSIKCDVTTVRNIELASGAGFKKGDDSQYFYTSPTTMHQFWTNDPLSRYKNPLQSDVIEYIKNNKEKLHPWFYAEAKKRRLIE